MRYRQILLGANRITAAAAEFGRLITDSIDFPEWENASLMGRGIDRAFARGR